MSGSDVLEYIFDKSAKQCYTIIYFVCKRADGKKKNSLAAAEENK